MPLEGPSPQPGDLIEFIRTLYQHWGVYVGKGNVVHLTDQEGFSSLSSALGGTAVVREDPIEIVAAGCIYRVNNKYDQKRRPYAPEKIVNSARREVGKKMKYSVTSANCEHFVTELRYDKAFCDQVDNAKTYATGGLLLAGAIGAIAAFSMQKNRQKQ
ncbi:phospholipase A and acyltransferase 4-like [Hyla sarda]|uniref:phospholipase A and acyltransferase 4-like n=1 Tax=Hyla sarda TaxID=327740 RepID=UPI0024C40A8A|nr:phospholipase A and acyltransferase 4-like [Hyla sarda]